MFYSLMLSRGEKDCDQREHFAFIIREIIEITKDCRCHFGVTTLTDSSMITLYTQLVQFKLHIYVITIFN